MARAIATEIIMQKDTDATHILAADHRAVEALFEEFKKASGADRKAKIAEKICTELKIHAQIEEEVFYPALKGKVDADLLTEAYEIGRAHVCNPVTNAHLVCRLMLEKKNNISKCSTTTLSIYKM